VNDRDDEVAQELARLFTSWPIGEALPMDPLRPGDLARVLDYVVEIDRSDLWPPDLAPDGLVETRCVRRSASEVEFIGKVWTLDERGQGCPGFIPVRVRLAVDLPNARLSSISCDLGAIPGPNGALAVILGDTVAIEEPDDPMSDSAALIASRRSQRITWLNVSHRS